MSFELRLPGEPQAADPLETETGQYTDLLGAEVVAATDVRVSREAGAAQVSEAQPDDVIELGWQDGIVELVRAGSLEEHFPQSVRSGDRQLEIPTRKTIRTTTRARRDVRLEVVKHLRVKVVEKAVGWAFPKVIEKLESRHIPKTGLYELDATGALGDHPVDGLAASDRPILVLIHGTFSSTQGGFGNLFESEDWPRLRNAYDGRVFALEQHTVTESPAGNALELASALPAGAKLHLLSHSRGGLVGDLLCRYPYEADHIAQFFSEPQYEEVRKQLEKLARLLAENQPVVERFARVAAPAAGTLLASERLDTYLNVILSVLSHLPLPGAGFLEFVKALATTIISTRTRADQLPGIESMMPHGDKGFVPFLNCTEARGQDLAVIAGDVRGGGIFDRVKDFFSHVYYREDNDFVVDSRSMFRGVPREKARGYYYRAPRADHFSYFGQEETRTRIVGWLAAGDDSGFEPLNATAAYGGLRAAATRAIPSPKEIEEAREDKPVVFLLPGIMGTHLARREEDEAKRYWIHVARMAWGGLPKLAIDEPGIEPHGLVEMVYEPLFHHLRKDYHVIPFGFDWRRPISESAELLARAVQHELDSHERPVRLLAHSMGGLVSRALILKHPEMWQTLKRRNGRLVMLGTPNYGSYVPAQVFTRQHKLMKRVAVADIRSSLGELTNVVRAYPGLVEMLPFKDDADLLDPEHWQGFGDYAPQDGVLGSARQFRQALDGGAIDPGAMAYVAGHAKETPAAMESAGGEVRFRYTGCGDGTVPWDLGLLEGIDTYYVDAEHGQIPNHKPSFDGFLELLADGSTRRLKTDPPVVQRGKQDLFDRTPEEGEEELRYYPDESDFVEAFAGRPLESDRVAAPPISLSVLNADVREAGNPVIVGHYKGDPIVNVEAALDRAVRGALSRDLRLGRYPGRLGEARIYANGDGPPGILVTGLGNAGDLKPQNLESALSAALMEHALHAASPEGEPLAELGVSSLLVGSYGGGRITIEDSVTALVDAALAVNQDLAAQGMADRVRIGRLEIVELFRDIATEAGHAVQTLQDRKEGRVVAWPIIAQRETARRSRPYSPYAKGWNRRIRVRADAAGIEYEVTTDIARNEPSQRKIQWKLVDSLLEDVCGAEQDAPETLFRYLLPYQLADAATNLPGVVLDLDPESARIPWELLDAPREGSAERVPVGARVSILRTLTAEDRRENPRRSEQRRALVIGEPAGVIPRLPGALKEAKAVEDLLQRRQMDVTSVPEAGAREILRALYASEYDIVHIAAHGEFNAEDTRIPEERRRPSGVVLGDGLYLTSHEFENLPAVPSIVFLNCCHLAKLEGSVGEREPLRQPGRFSASLAQHLIEMGVGVVVAAGWPVGDEPARVFAETLYGALLDGRDLSYAVRSARQATHVVCDPADLTWGAYQVYGDPGFVLHWAGRRPGGAAFARSFVSTGEMVEHILDFQSRGRGVRRAKREELREELLRLERGIPPAWRQVGAISGALGAAYAELGFYEDAIPAYEKAVLQSDAPIEAIEQLADAEKRVAEKANEAGDRSRARGLLVRSSERLKSLCAVSPSAERWSLLGASRKRLATIGGSRSRTRLLKDARTAYQAAVDLEPPNLYYPLENKFTLDLLLGDTDLDRKELEAIVESAAASSDTWAPMTVVNAKLLELLVFDVGSCDEVARDYSGAIRGGAGTTARERDSVVRHIEWIEELTSDEAVARSARNVLDCLEKILD